ncbi:MAG TPA: methylated-DNA--[protein]-cysteine S-methyltransferase [Terriglobales bacterium]|nr:methylated-DNA--[protein]-cysteine S-methyltransferase [Terriglobales bacterium]
MFHSYLDTPIGRLLLVSDGEVLIEIHFESDGQPVAAPPDSRADDTALAQAARELSEYFSGRRRSFEVAIGFRRGTEFQREVWQALRDIPFGTTISYGELARRVRRPNGFRAVGAANGRNPLPIVVPCHRVIGSDGTLTGFGGGLPTKQHLLQLEGCAIAARAISGPGRHHPVPSRVSNGADGRG